MNHRSNATAALFAVVATLAVVSTPMPVMAQRTTVPSPESVLGFPPGADFRLATYDESLGYFRQLDAASDRLTLVEVGRTSEGKEWYFALISSPENLANVERIGKSCSAWRTRPI